MNPPPYSYSDVSKMIDHSLLNPTLTVEQLEQGIQLALAYDVASVCILPYYLKRCADLLKGSSVKASTTIGFPHGGNTTQIKIAEAERALRDGGEELDMVVNISQVLSGDWDYVCDEIGALVRLTHGAGRKIKVIFENAYLCEEHKVRLCQISTDLGADWVKTSTGYAPTGATLEDLKLMVANVKPPVQVKAAGGVRDLETLLKVRELGVTRCGASATKAMLDPARAACGLAPIANVTAGIPAGY